MLKDFLTKVSILLIFSIPLFGNNPIPSPTFDDILKDTIKESKYIFDDNNIIIKVPQFADNPTQVPIYINATKIIDADKIIIFADLNPLPKILEMNPIDIDSILSFNIKVAQETPLRVLVHDSKDLWHIASANIKSSGGGCSVSGGSHDGKEYQSLFGESKSHVIKKDNGYRVKFSIFHPMETGLFFGKTPFYINNITIKNGDKVLATLKTTSGISENPRIMFETKSGNGSYKILLRDVDANEYEISTNYKD